MFLPCEALPRGDPLDVPAEYLWLAPEVLLGGVLVGVVVARGARQDGVLARRPLGVPVSKQGTLLKGAGDGTPW